MTASSLNAKNSVLNNFKEMRIQSNLKNISVNSISNFNVSNTAEDTNSNNCIGASNICDQNSSLSNSKPIAAQSDLKNNNTNSLL